MTKMTETNEPRYRLCATQHMDIQRVEYLGVGIELELFDLGSDEDFKRIMELVELGKNDFGELERRAGIWDHLE